MRIADILDRDSIIEELNSSEKEGVLRELVSLLARRGKIKEEARALEVLFEREKLGSTGIGEGIAIPHGKLPDLERIVCAFGRSKKGVDFEAVDGNPVHLVFLLLAPENSTTEHLKALARLSRLLKDPLFRKKLLEAQDKDGLYQTIVEGDEGQG
ncbi:MAG: PTS sugar transporter subunit IIA [Deltaproteobacteria bacterium]|nr:MAG: PTS sugar transporter subunit IIA [Deltaproteobacteria bacterium]